MLFSFTKEKGICIFKFPGLTPCYKQTDQQEAALHGPEMCPQFLPCFAAFTPSAVERSCPDNLSPKTLLFFTSLVFRIGSSTICARFSGRESLVYISSQGSCLNPPGQSGEGSGCNGAEM